MPLFGAHMSIAGGYYKALAAARALNCDVVQLFTKNNNQWRGKPLSAEDVRLFRDLLRDTKLQHLTAHDSYLINLASPDAELYKRSVEAFREEIERAEALGLQYLVTHPGTATDGKEAPGLRRIARALDQVHRSCKGFKVRVLLEVTAGQGRTLGHRFEHLGRILELVKAPERLGVCLDTCHVHAAGYPLAPAAEYAATMDQFDQTVGLARIEVFHVNDSVKPLGSRVDRHAAIGRGSLGLEAFRLLVNDPRFVQHPMILETPKEDDDGNPMDPVNLKVLRDLVGG
jgi:deoxyribonuclease-4